jgi:hypothetical protein
MKNIVIRVILLLAIVISMNACIAAGGILGGAMGSISIKPVDNSTVNGD